MAQDAGSVQTVSWKVDFPVHAMPAMRMFLLVFSIIWRAFLNSSLSLMGWEGGGMGVVGERRGHLLNVPMVPVSLSY